MNHCHCRGYLASMSWHTAASRRLEDVVYGPLRAMQHQSMIVACEGAAVVHYPNSKDVLMSRALTADDIVPEDATRAPVYARALTESDFGSYYAMMKVC